VTRPRTVRSRATIRPTTLAPAAMVSSVPRNSPSMLQRISHGPSHTTLPMIGASARSAHAVGRAAGSGTSGAPADTLAVALPGILPPRILPLAASYHVSRACAADAHDYSVDFCTDAVGAAVVQLHGSDDAAAGGRARPPSNCLISTVDSAHAGH